MGWGEEEEEEKRKLYTQHWDDKQKADEEFAATFIALKGIFFSLSFRFVRTGNGGSVKGQSFNASPAPFHFVVIAQEKDKKEEIDEIGQLVFALARSLHFCPSSKTWLMTGVEDWHGPK